MSGPRTELLNLLSLLSVTSSQTYSAFYQITFVSLAFSHWQNPTDSTNRRQDLLWRVYHSFCHSFWSQLSRLLFLTFRGTPSWCERRRDSRSVQLSHENESNDRHHSVAGSNSFWCFFEVNCIVKCRYRYKFLRCSFWHYYVAINPESNSPTS